MGNRPTCCSTSLVMPQENPPLPQMAPPTHKWAKEIKAFVDGEAVQWRGAGHTSEASWILLDPTLYKLQSFDQPGREFRIAPPRVEKWANLYESSVSGLWNTREMADQIKSGTRLAFIKLTFEDDKPVAVELVQP